VASSIKHKYKHCQANAQLIESMSLAVHRDHNVLYSSFAPSHVSTEPVFLSMPASSSIIVYSTYTLLHLTVGTLSHSV